MDTTKIRIPLEIQLSNELYELFEGDIVEKVMSEGRIEDERDLYKPILEGHSFRVTSKMAPHIYDLCKKTEEALKFDEKIDYYIANNNETNCMTILRKSPEKNHVIIFNSGLIERFDDDELKFVIGHEIGHLITQNTKLFEIIKFVFPDPEKIPLIFRNKISLWQRLSELVADRYGFIASPKLDKAISNFFKLSAGLDTSRIKFDAQSYLEEIEKALEYFQKEPFAFHSSHPINPVRVKAIKIFSESELFKKIIAGQKVEPDQVLNKQIDELIKVLIIVGNSELDIHRSYFIASGGIIVSGLDDQINMDELNAIIINLAGFTMFPKAFLDSIIKSGKVNEFFIQSAQNILKFNPGERYQMLNYLAGVAMADKEIAQREIDFLYDVGVKILQFSKKETAQIIGDAIQKKFLPKLFLS